jgi:hypothetical protein
MQAIVNRHEPHQGCGFARWKRIVCAAEQRSGQDSGAGIDIR